MRTLGIETSCDETAVAVLDATAACAATWSPRRSPRTRRTSAWCRRSPPATTSRRCRGCSPRPTASSGLARRRAGRGHPRSRADRLAARRHLLRRRLRLGAALPLVGVDHLEGHLVSPFLPSTARRRGGAGARRWSSSSRAATRRTSSSQAARRGRSTAPATTPPARCSTRWRPRSASATPAGRSSTASPRAATRRVSLHRAAHQGPRRRPRLLVLGPQDGGDPAPRRGSAPLPLADPGRPPQPVLDLLATFRRTVSDWLLAPLDELAAPADRSSRPPEAWPPTASCAGACRPGGGPPGSRWFCRRSR